MAGAGIFCKIGKNTMLRKINESAKDAYFFTTPAEYFALADQ